MKHSFVAVELAYLHRETLEWPGPDAGPSQQEIALEAPQVPIEGSCIAQEYCSYLPYRSVEGKTAGLGIETGCIAVGVEHVAGFVGFELHMDCFVAGPSEAVGIADGFELVDLGRSTPAVVVTGHSMVVAGMSVHAAAERMG